MSAHAHSDRDPPTEVMGVLEGVTTAGAPAALSLQHLHSLLTTLAPLREAYANAAVDRLRGLPRESRRALLPHVLHEYPDLAEEPRIRALADDVGLDLEKSGDRPDLVQTLARVAGVNASTPEDAIDRVERALTTLATALARIAATESRVDAAAPLDAHEILARALDAGDDAAEIATRVETTLDASRDAIGAALDRDELAAFEARASVPRWWPSPFREAALWSRVRADRKRLRTERAEAFEVALHEALRARAGRERA